jgi:RimJ/RimL family protein N-acetyltransferase
MSAVPYDITLRTDGLLLRPFQEADTDEVYQAAFTSRSELARWTDWCHEDYQRHETADFIAAQPSAWSAGQGYAFGIWDAATGHFLGGTGLNNFNAAYQFANLGYWVRSDATGRGVASAAARCLARWAFSEFELVRLEIVVATGNTASQRVAEKAGALREGILRNRITLHNQPLDAVMFSLTPQDFGCCK